MAVLVCSTLCIFFYTTYFIKMHDASATFMVILESVRPVCTRRPFSR